MERVFEVREAVQEQSNGVIGLQKIFDVHPRSKGGFHRYAEGDWKLGTGAKTTL